jgi:hypothetical protein
MIFSYHIETTLESNFKIDRHLVSQISYLVENQKIDANSQELINVSVNSLLENNHSLLLRSIDLIWVLGFAFMMWLFPYHVFLRTDKFKT